MAPPFVDTVNDITQLIDVGLPAGTSLLYIDIEGRKPACPNSISIMTILSVQSNMTYIVDVATLHDLAFTTPGSDGQTTIKSILESATITKVFSSMQNSRQLLADYLIRLQRAEDIRIMERAYRFATNTMENIKRNFIVECAQKDLTNSTVVPVPLFCQQVVAFLRLLSDPQYGGPNNVLFRRPLHPDITTY
jgi:hypothetical protein